MSPNVTPAAAFCDSPAARVPFAATSRASFRVEDVAVVIPTRDRWPVLARTLAALGRQSVAGFSTTVVVDGTDQRAPRMDGVDMRVVTHRGPGGARNAGVQVVRRPLVLFLGDDMVPDRDLVRSHLDAHNRHPGPNVAVLGKVDWHPEVARGRIERWMDWSGNQFDFPPPGHAEHIDAGFGRFYSCNVSLTREHFLGSGGFDESFAYYYEDLDCGYRLGEKGMRLVYEPAARCLHLHRYDMVKLERRFRGIGSGEHMMDEKHRWFSPFFLDRVRAARAAPPASRAWSLAAGMVPSRFSRIASHVRSRADTWYLQQLSEPFLAGWWSASEASELAGYLGTSFDQRTLESHEHAVHEERSCFPDDDTFYRNSRSYLYDLTAFAMSGTKAPYRAEIHATVRPGARILDYGCGIGSDGIQLAHGGFDVSFADFANPSTEYLRWRLRQRGWANAVYDIERDEFDAPFDAVYSFDVIEHVVDPFGFLARLEELAPVVVVNLLDDSGPSQDEHSPCELHRPLPIREILNHAYTCSLVRYRRYHGRSHLVVYRSPRFAHPRGARRIRGRMQRTFGDLMAGRDGWHPLP